MVDAAAVKAARGVTERAACRRLHALAGQVKAAHAIVELGAYRGRTTGWLALGASRGHGAHVWSVDPWGRLAGDAVSDAYAAHEPNYRNGRYSGARGDWKRHVDAIGATRLVTAVCATAVEAAEGWSRPVGLLFHDAVHDADTVAADLTVWAPHVVAGGVVALHDVGDPHYGVEEGAARVLDAPGWEWAGRERRLWKRHPERRGLLVVRRSS